MKLGEALLEERLITAAQLEEALRRQQEAGGALGSILVELGYLDEAAVAAALAKKYRITAIDPAATPPSTGVLLKFFAEVTQAEAQKLRVYPLDIQGQTLTLAMADPTDVRALDEIRFRTGLVVEPRLAPTAFVFDRLAEFRRPSPMVRIPRVRRFSDRVDSINGTSTAALELPAVTTPVASADAYAAGAILVETIRHEARAIHFEIYPALLRIRLRIEGRLHVVFQKRRTELRFDPWGVVSYFRALAAASPVGEGRFLARYEILDSRREHLFAPHETELLGGLKLVIHRLSVHDAAGSGDSGEWISERYAERTPGLRPEAIFYAAREGRDDVVRALIALGTDPNAAHRGVRPVIAAARGGHAEAVRSLLERGADPAATDHLGQDALTLAAFGGHAITVHVLLESGRVPAASVGRALRLAAGEGHLSVVKRLLAAEPEDLGRALFIASSQDHPEVVVQLLEAFRQSGAPEPRSWSSALAGAAAVGGVETIDLLLLAASSSPSTLSLGSALYSLLDGAFALRSPGSFVSAVVSKRRRTEQDVGRDLDVEARYQRALGRLLAAGGPEQGLNDQEFLAELLVRAARAGMPRLVETLLEFGADVDGTDKAGNSPLGSAIPQSDLRSLRLLLEAGAAVGLDELTALASTGRHLFELLRREQIRWRESDLAELLRYARRLGHEELVTSLERCGARAALDRRVIDEAQALAREGRRRLDLSGRELTRIPSDIFEIDAFESIDLSNNQLEKLPAGVGRTSRLAELHLSGNLLSKLPEELQLSNLTRLDLSRNRLDELPDGLWRLKRLESLKLAGNGLAALPDGIGALVALSELDVSRNRLAALPEPIFGLSELESLDASDNRLARLSPDARNWKRLRRLELGGNPIAGLPIELEALEELSTLGLERTLIREIPEVLRQGRLKKLGTLRLSSTGIRSLGSALAEWLSLERLELNDLELGRCPPEIGKLRRLKRLELRGNALRSLPAELKALKSLEELDLRDNRLESLPEFLEELQALGRLETGGNPLEVPIGRAQSAKR